MTDPETLVEAAFDVCTALEGAGSHAVLTGGSAATFYAPQACQSDDIDFVLTFQTNTRAAAQALANIGFELRDDRQSYRRAEIILEFPPGPLTIGAYVLPEGRHSRYERGSRNLNVLTATDAVCNRLVSYYAWNDYSARRAAVAIASTHPEQVQLSDVRGWTLREYENIRSDQRESFNEFLSDLERIGLATVEPIRL